MTINSNILVILGIVLVILKLANLIDWSWFWVLLPFILTGFFVTLILGVFTFCFIVFGVVVLGKGIK